MAEIKLNDAFNAEVDAFRSAGAGLNAGSSGSSGSGVSLPTVDGYLQRLTAIKNVMTKFEELTNKDATDMESIAAKLKAADASG